MENPRLSRLLCRIDQINRGDPATTVVDETPWPSEFVYSQRVTRWIKKLAPAPSEALLIAARGQHIRRWSIPRGDYPEGRAGYLKWRETLKRMHADTLAGLMREEAYDRTLIDRVTAIVLKRDLKDPETQALEDALCLVFLETQFDALSAKTDEDKMIGILRKTWNKMSPAAQAAAKALSYSEAGRGLLDRALAA